MCAEREPLDCHRTILVAREIERAGIPILHILGDGALEEHGAAMRRLIEKLKIPQDDLFGASGNAVELAYEKQAQRMGYKKPQGNP